MIHGVGTDDTRGGIDIWFVLGVYLQIIYPGHVTEHIRLGVIRKFDTNNHKLQNHVTLYYMVVFIERIVYI